MNEAVLIIWEIWIGIVGALAIIGWFLYFRERKRRSKSVTSPLNSQENHPDIIANRNKNTSENHNTLHIS